MERVETDVQREGEGGGEEAGYEEYQEIQHHDEKVRICDEGGPGFTIRTKFGS